MKYQTYSEFQAVEREWSQVLENDQQASIFQTWDWNRLWFLAWGKERFAELRRRGCGGEASLALGLVWDQGRAAVLVPLLRLGRYAELLGGEAVTDYMDVLVAEGANQARLAEFIKQEWRRQGIERVGIFNARAESHAEKMFGFGGRLRPAEVAPFVDLRRFKRWEDYLDGLKRKQRHELKRKLRRLNEAGGVSWCPAEVSAGELADFFRLHRASRRDKREFMTAKMAAFFRRVAQEFNPRGWLDVCYLKINQERVAGVWSFVWRNKVLLYNSGFDPTSGYFATGLMLKALSIKRAIEAGREEYDFLRGNERYKYDLGGVDRRLYEFEVRV